MKITGLLLPWVLLAALTSVVAADETPARPWLGVYLEEDAERGVEIVEVVGGGPAHRAGIRRGDLLRSLGETTIDTAEDVSRFLDGARVGTAVEATVLREGKRELRTIELQARPASWAPVDSAAAIRAREDALRRAARWRATLRGLPGLTVVEIPDDLRAHYGAPRGRGVLVSRVVEGSVSAAGGVQVGDVLTRVGDAVVRTPAELVPAVQASAGGSELKLEVVRAGKPVVLLLDLVPAPITEEWQPVGEGDGVERSVRIRLLERELERLERRMREVREELRRLEDGR